MPPNRRGRPARFGVKLPPPMIDFAAVNAHVQGVIAGIAPHDSQERFEGLGATVIRAAAAFTGPKEVAAGDYRIRARRFVIATGSTPFVPPLPGLDKLPYFTNETIFDLTKQPRHLLVIGGGPDRLRAGAGLPAPGRRGDGRGDGPAAAEGRSGRRRPGARPPEGGRRAPAGGHQGHACGGCGRRHHAGAGRQERAADRHRQPSADRRRAGGRTSPGWSWRKRASLRRPRASPSMPACAPAIAAFSPSAMSSAACNSPMPRDITLVSSSAAPCSACRRR